MKINLERRIFAAAIHCAAQKDMRNYLNGVCLRLNGTEGNIYATNGHMLFAGAFVLESFDDMSDCTGAFDILIPLATAKEIAKGYGKRNVLQTLFTLLRGHNNLFEI
jgi:DNA polymerase III sliding clamp (beta) subunit (PCNA family)